MNNLEYIKLVIADAKAFWHIEDLDLDMKESRDLCNRRIETLLGNVSGTEEYQRKYIFESVGDWEDCIKYLNFLEKEYLSIDGKT